MDGVADSKLEEKDLGGECLVGDNPVAEGGRFEA